jgi:hypothetical protein
MERNWGRDLKGAMPVETPQAAIVDIQFPYQQSKSENESLKESFLYETKEAEWCFFLVPFWLYSTTFNSDSLEL